jgi:hypothetical protein
MALSESPSVERDSQSWSHEVAKTSDVCASQELGFDPFVERLVGGAPGEPPDSAAGSLSLQRLKAPVLQRAQRLYGNRASQQIVMRARVLQRQCTCGGTCAKCQQEEEQRALQRSSASAAPVDFDGIPASYGDPLDAAARRPLEAHFEADLTDVRVHTGSEAATSATSLDALAYTSGRDIYFAAGMYSPASSSGQRLLAHEVAHVVQQRSGKEPSIATKSARGVKIGAPDDSLETEADRATEEFMSGAQPSELTDEEQRRRRESGGPVQRFIQRQPAPATPAAPASAPAAAPPPAAAPQSSPSIRYGKYTLTDDAVQVKAELLKIASEHGTIGLDDVSPWLRQYHNYELCNTPGNPSDACQAWIQNKNKIIAVVDKVQPEARSEYQDAEMQKFLGDKSKELQQVREDITKHPLDTPEGRAALRPQLERLVRLNAVKLMGEHRGEITAARARLLAMQSGPGGAQKLDTVSRSKEVEDIRNAARAVNQLNADKKYMEDHRRAMHFARSDTIFRRGDVVDVIIRILQPGFKYLDQDQIKGLQESFDIAKSRNTRDDFWLFAYGASTYLEELRTKQIFGVEQAISAFYEKYPMFAILEPEDVVGKKYGSDNTLIADAQAAYNDVIAKVDAAIGDIAGGSPHPFDMPKAVQVTRESLPEAGQKALDEAKQDHEVKRFWLTMALTLLEAVVVFIPVVGPAIAVGIGVGLVGSQLADMLERVRIARASANPYKATVGVAEPTAFEWVMVSVGAILTAVGAAAVFRSLRGALREPSPELLAEIGEPVGTTTQRTSEIPYGSPPEMQTLRGRPLDLNSLDPSKKYVWVIDEHGNFLLAPEDQAAVGFAPGRPTPGVVKHGDLTPGPGGQTRGVARAGGELYPETVDGKPTGRWIMDNNSSYTFARKAGGGERLPPSPPSSLDASKQLLGHYGTDTARIVTKNVLP